MDERLLHALHVQALRHAELHPEHAAHVVFQTSTIGALLDGAYDGDVTIGEALEHGDHGLGTLDALDGELVVVDGEAFAASVDGDLRPVDPAERTPFAVLTAFAADVTVPLRGPLTLDELLAVVDEHCDDLGAHLRWPDAADAPSLGASPPSAPLRGGATLVHPVRIDGTFERVRARSVPRQHPPYRPLADVVAEQHVFDLPDLTGTMVGFRFPADAGAINVPGHHLHVADAARRRGGHVFDCVLREGTLRVDHSADVHAELPPGVEIATTAAEATAIAAAERER